LQEVYVDFPLFELEFNLIINEYKMN